MHVSRHFATVLGLVVTLTAPQVPLTEARQATPQTDLCSPAREECAAGGINASGQIVGWVQPSADVQHAALWDDGQMTDLGTLGGDWALADAIDDRGQVVGTSTTAPGQTSFGSGTHAFIWYGGDLIDLNTTIQPAATRSLTVANGINAVGQIVGWAGLYEEGTQAVVLTPG